MNFKLNNNHIPKQFRQVIVSLVAYFLESLLCPSVFLGECRTVRCDTGTSRRHDLQTAHAWISQQSVRTRLRGLPQIDGKTSGMIEWTRRRFCSAGLVWIDEALLSVVQKCRWNQNVFQREWRRTISRRSRQISTSRRTKGRIEMGESCSRCKAYLMTNFDWPFSKSSYSVSSICSPISIERSNT